MEFDTRLVVRVSKKQAEKVKLAAKLKRMSVSDYLRRLIKDAEKTDKAQ